MNLETTIAHLSRTLDLTERSHYVSLVVGEGAQAIPDIMASASRAAISPAMAGDLVKRILDVSASEDACSALESKVDDRAIPQDVRLLAMRLIRQYFTRASHVARTLLQIARDEREPELIRAEALRVLIDVKPPTADLTHVSRLLGDTHINVILAAVDVMEANAALLPADTACRDLEILLAHNESNVRRRAISLLGRFAEIDVIERVCMLPATDPAERSAIHKLIDDVMARPRDVLRLHPKNFEHLVMRVLRKLNFQELNVVGGSWDGGVDVRGCREDANISGKAERFEYVVQCKRHSKPIGEEHVADFIRAIESNANPRTRGLLVATAPFLDKARNAARSRSIEFIDGARLQELLDEHFHPGAYVVRRPSR